VQITVGPIAEHYLSDQHIAQLWAWMGEICAEFEAEVPGSGLMRREPLRYLARRFALIAGYEAQLRIILGLRAGVVDAGPCSLAEIGAVRRRIDAAWDAILAAQGYVALSGTRFRGMAPCEGPVTFCGAVHVDTVRCWA